MLTRNLLFSIIALREPKTKRALDDKEKQKENPGHSETISELIPAFTSATEHSHPLHQPNFKPVKSRQKRG